MVQRAEVIRILLNSIMVRGGTYKQREIIEYYIYVPIHCFLPDLLPPSTSLVLLPQVCDSPSVCVPR